MKITETQTNEILRYCYGHTNKKRIAKIVSIILGCDLRDAETQLNKYFEE